MVRGMRFRMSYFIQIGQNPHTHTLSLSCHSPLLRNSIAGMDYQGGGGGGGFSSGGSPPGSSGGQQQQRARRSYDEQTIQPLTIRMALSARDPDGTGAELDGRKLYHIKLVGAVRSVTPNTSNVVFDIEDGTGLIQVKQWLDQQNESPRMTELREQASRENIYVRIVGQLKDYNGSTMLLADSIRPISTGNELAHHMLDVVYAGEMAKRKTEYVAPQPMVMGGGGGIGFGGGGGTPMVSSTGNGTGDKLTDEVLSFFREHSVNSEVGASLHSTMQYLGGRYSEGQVRSAIENLSAEGTLYSTIDEEHYKYAM